MSECWKELFRYIIDEHRLRKIEAAREVADPVPFFDQGKVVKSGTPSDVFGSPREPDRPQFLANALR